MPSLRFGTILIAVICLQLSCKARVDASNSNISATDIQPKSELLAALQEAGISEDEIRQILQQEAELPEDDVAGVWVLGPNDTTRLAGVSPDTIRLLIERKDRAHMAALASAGLATAGLALIFTPLPGARVMSVIVMKNAVAVGAIYFAGSAAYQYEKGAAMEIRDLNDLRPLLQSALERLIVKSGSHARLQVGSIADVNIDSRRYVSFTTSERHRFVSQDLGPLAGTVFVTENTSFNPFSSDQSGRVLSIIDGGLIPIDTFLSRNAHLAACLSDRYQEDLKAAILSLREDLRNGITTTVGGRTSLGNSLDATPVQRYTKADLASEAKAAADALSYFENQWGVLAGRAYKHSDSATWEAFQSRRREMMAQTAAISGRSLVPLGDMASRLIYLEYLRDVYALLRPIAHERSKLLSRQRPSNQKYQ